MSNGSMPEFGKSARQKAEEEPKNYGPPAFSGDPFASTPTPYTIQTNRNNKVDHDRFHVVDEEFVADKTEEVTPPDLSEEILEHDGRTKLGFRKKKEHKKERKQERRQQLREEEPKIVGESGDPFAEPAPKPIAEEKPSALPKSRVPKRRSSGSPFKIIAKSTKSATKKIESAAGPNLAFICIILGALALIASGVAVWALLNRNPNGGKVATVSSITTAEGSLAAKTLSFSQSKITNALEDTVYRLNATRANTAGNPVISATISPEGKSINITVYWNTVKDFYSITTSKVEKETFTIDYEKTVSDVIIAQNGNSSAGDVILALLSDGTVQYIPVLMSLQTKSFSTSGQLNGVADIVKFYVVDGTSASGNTVAFTTILAQKHDGTLIDLQSYLKSASGQGNKK